MTTVPALTPRTTPGELISARDAEDTVTDTGNEAHEDTNEEPQGAYIHHNPFELLTTKQSGPNDNSSTLPQITTTPFIPPNFRIHPTSDTSEDELEQTRGNSQSRQ